MKIVAARDMPFVREAFSTLGDVTLLEGRGIRAADVRDADMLVTRSTTQVNRALLDGSRVRFYGTATIGTDHMDIAWLEAQGVRWCSAAGCNANSVSEYITAALLELGARRDRRLAENKLGIVGVGNVGSRVLAKARALGMTPLLNDPPRERAEGEWIGSEPEDRLPFLALDEVLETADIVTLHVPLTDDGPDATRHMAAKAFLDRMKPGAVLINAARGPVIETAALLDAMARGHVADAVIDCWEGEPDFSPALMARCLFGTPHIAGYSYDGKVNGTVMVYRAACRFLGVTPTWSADTLLPPAAVPHIDVASSADEQAVCRDVVRRVYDLAADDQPLREAVGLDEADRRARFDALRKTYPARREFHATRLSLQHEHPAADRLAGLGFQVTAS